MRFLRFYLSAFVRFSFQPLREEYRSRTLRNGFPYSTEKSLSVPSVPLFYQS